MGLNVSYWPWAVAMVQWGDLVKNDENMNLSFLSFMQYVLTFYD